MCDIHFKSKLKRRKTFVENQQGTRSPREAPNRNRTWQESPAIPESRAWGGPQAGTGESKARTGPYRSPRDAQAARTWIHQAEPGLGLPLTSLSFGKAGIRIRISRFRLPFPEPRGRDQTSRLRKHVWRLVTGRKRGS